MPKYIVKKVPPIKLAEVQSIDIGDILTVTIHRRFRDPDGVEQHALAIKECCIGCRSGRAHIVLSGEFYDYFTYQGEEEVQSLFDTEKNVAGKVVSEMMGDFAACLGTNVVHTPSAKYTLRKGYAARGLEFLDINTGYGSSTISLDTRVRRSLVEPLLVLHKALGDKMLSILSLMEDINGEIQALNPKSEEDTESAGA